MKYKLIASDMDGTLLNEKSELTQRTKEAIIKAVDAGVIFVTATGRPFSNVQNVNELFSTEQDMPFIVFNGAAAYLGKSGKLLFERFLDFDLAREAFDIGQKLGVPQIIWTGPQLWASHECKETITYQNLGKVKMSISSNISEIKDQVEGISKVLWIDDPANVKKLSVKMNTHFNGKLKCVSSMPHFLEFISNDAGKGTALAEVGRLFGIDKSEMIAIGDGYNDVGMLKYVGFGVAVENAPDDIKSICKHVTSSNDNDGVAEVIEKFVLL